MTLLAKCQTTQPSSLSGNLANTGHFRPAFDGKGLSTTKCVCFSYNERHKVTESQMGYFPVVHHPSTGRELRVCHRPGPLILRKITTPLFT